MRALEQGLPRFDMRSPALIARQGQLSLPKSVTVPATEIIAQVASQAGLTTADLLGSSLQRQVIRARREAISRVRAAFPTMNGHQLGRLFKRSRSNVYYALGKVPDRPLLRLKPGRKAKGGEHG